MANRLAVCIAHFDFLREGERFSPSVSVTLGHQGLLALAVRHQEEICLVSGRPTGLALGAGMAKSCRAAQRAST